MGAGDGLADDGGGQGASPAGGDQVVAPRPDLALMGGYHSPQVEVEVRLNTNESPVPPPAGFVEDLQSALAEVAFHRYPDRRAARLRAALAEHHGVAPEQVFCANGSNEAIQALLLAYGGTGRTAVTFEPTYALHAHIARVTATAVVSGPRREDLTVDPGELRAVLAEAAPAVCFLCSPNNPTGQVEPEEVVEEAVATAPGLVVVDEAYGQFAPTSALSLVAGGGRAAERLVVVRTFSKTWSLAAVRLGYLVGPAPVVAALEEVALPYHLDAVKQRAGCLALRYEDEMRERVRVVVAERERLAAALRALPVDVWPSAANFILFRPRHLDGREVWQGLLEASVLVRDCSTWPGLAGCLRVTVGTGEENARFVSVLRKVLG